MNTLTITDEFLVAATPTTIYDVLMTSEGHAKLVGAEAMISDDLNSFFSIYDGYITGENILLEKPFKIVQKWRAEEEGWPKDHFSIVTFNLIEQQGKTLVKFSQEKLPAHLESAIQKGWVDFYWNPLKEMFSPND